jgi:hypothetical protein
MWLVVLESFWLLLIVSLWLVVSFEPLLLKYELR